LSFSEKVLVVNHNWHEREERQQKRIKDGLSEQYHQIINKKKQNGNQKYLRVVGRCPIDMVDHFKNRYPEQKKIRKLLLKPTTRLITVLGHGGMGKTALVSKVLLDLEFNRWPDTEDSIPFDGIVYLSTRTAEISLEHLFLKCAELLDNKHGKRILAIWTNPKLKNEDKVIYLLESLKNGRYIILLDNIEDMLDEERCFIDNDLKIFFDKILFTSHGVCLLVTSREPLSLKMEVMRYDSEVKLESGLPIPDGITLLRELDPNGDCGLKNATEQQLSEAIERVHGLPRALELIVGILKEDPWVSLSDVIKEFYRKEDVVLALIEEQYKRLDINARKVLEAISVFKFPIDILAVDYLLEPFVPGLDAPNIIKRLARSNIVKVNRDTKIITLHPIDRDYLYSQLPENETNKTKYTRCNLELRAANYYSQLRTPTESWENIDDIKPQLAEFEHRILAIDHKGAFQVLELIDGHLSLWGHYTRLVEQREKLLGHLSYPFLQMINLGKLGILYRTLGQNIEQAIKFLQKSLSISRAIADRKNEGIWLGNLGNIYRDLGKLKQAVEYYKQSQSIAHEIGDRKNEGVWLGNIGLAYRNMGHVEQIDKFYKQALDIARKIRDYQGESTNLSRLGSLYHT